MLVISRFMKKVVKVPPWIACASNLFIHKQHEFFQSTSSFTGQFSFINLLRGLAKRGMAFAVIYFHIPKAFNRVLHQHPAF